MSKNKTLKIVKCLKQKQLAALGRPLVILTTDAYFSLSYNITSIALDTSLFDPIISTKSIRAVQPCDPKVM